MAVDFTFGPHRGASAGFDFVEHRRDYILRGSQTFPLILTDRLHLQPLPWAPVGLASVEHHRYYMLRGFRTAPVNIAVDVT